MTRTVQQLIEQLQVHPGNAVISIEDIMGDEYFITALNPTANGLDIVIDDVPKAEEESNGE